MNEPLAERIRPKSLDDYVSQQHLVGETGSLRNQIKKVSSLPLYYGALQEQVKQH